MSAPSIEHFSCEGGRGSLSKRSDLPRRFGAKPRCSSRQTNAFSCSGCPVDTYKDAVGNASCTPCPDSFSTFGVTNATNISKCLCGPGFEIVSAGGQHHYCSGCAPGQFKAIASLDMCVQCEAGKFAASGNATICSSCGNSEAQFRCGT